MIKKLLILLGLKKDVPLNGFHAARQGFAFDDNPYKKHTPAHSIWRDDWLFEKGHRLK